MQYWRHLLSEPHWLGVLGGRWSSLAACKATPPGVILSFLAACALLFVNQTWLRLCCCVEERCRRLRIMFWVWGRLVHSGCRVSNCLTTTICQVHDCAPWGPGPC